MNRPTVGPENRLKRWTSYDSQENTQPLRFGVGKVYIHSLEDLILYKLMYFGLNQQSKHSRDIAAILKSKKDELDLDYIDGWVTRLGLSSLWKEMLDSGS